VSVRVLGNRTLCATLPAGGVAATKPADFSTNWEENPPAGQARRAVRGSLRSTFFLCTGHRLHAVVAPIQGHTDSGVRHFFMQAPCAGVRAMGSIPRARRSTDAAVMR
jgi:hypothetical protein